jgi:hypothetical protein
MKVRKKKCHSCLHNKYLPCFCTSLVHEANRSESNNTCKTKVKYWLLQWKWIFTGSKTCCIIWRPFWFAMVAIFNQKWPPKYKNPPIWAKFSFQVDHKSCQTLRWIFLQSFMKFDERNPNFFLFPPFSFLWQLRQSLSNRLRFCLASAKSLSDTFLGNYWTEINETSQEC